MSEILSFIDALVFKALKQGADEVEIFAQKFRTKKANVEHNTMKSALASFVEGVGIRVLKNKALGFASVNSFDKKKIVEGLKEALSIAKVTPPEDYYYLSSPQKITIIPDLYDPAIEVFSMNDTISYCNSFLKTTLEIDPRITIDSCSFSANVMENVLVNSKGVTASERKSIFDWTIFGMAVDGDVIGSFDFVSDSVVKVKDISLDKTATDFSQKVLRNLYAKKTSPFEGPAVLTPEAVPELFWLLVNSALATSIQSGSSFLQDKLGEKITIDELSIIDNGTLKNHTASSSFDREGIPHKRFPIIDNGIFTGILYDTFTANKENLSSTGHAAGGFRNSPYIWTTNLEIQSGNKPSSELISEIDHGIIINRISASPDPISGDFSAALKGAQLIEKGEITDTLREITAVGNIFTNLHTITGISKEQKTLQGDNQSWIVPYLVLDKIKFVS